MERLELAIRRYSQIVPRALEYSDLPRHQLRVWLDEDVCPAIEDYIRRPTFRENASWSIRALRPGADSDERRLIEITDLNLVAFAHALRSLTRNKRIAGKLTELFPSERIVARETAVIRSTGTRMIDRHYTDIPVVPRLLSQVDAIASRPWPDLVNVDDYFEPQQEYARQEDGRYIQSGEWIVSLNADLLPVGHFVVRCLLKRIQIRVDVLNDLWLKCQQSLEQMRTPYSAFVRSAKSGWDALSSSFDHLKVALKVGHENRIRDACVAAVQIYAACHLRPDLDWLGLGSASTHNRQFPLQARLAGLQGPHVFDRVAASLRDLQRLYVEDHPKQSEIEEAIAGGGLVVLVSKKKAYWATKPITGGLNGRRWEMLAAIARKGRLGAVVELRDVFGDRIVGRSTMSTTWNRLKPVLPPNLRKLIVPGRNLPGTYELLLDPHQVHFFA